MTNVTTVGLLLLDSLDHPHRDLAGDYDTLFADLLRADDIDLRLFDGRAADLPDHGDCDGWVIPGSRQSVYDDDRWIRAMERWTVEALDRRVPLAGVCFGQQLIARVLGSPVTKSELGWNIGAIDYELHPEASPTNSPSPTDPPMPERFRLIASHQDQVQELPPGATLLASSARCPIAGYTIDRHLVAGWMLDTIRPDRRVTGRP